METHDFEFGEFVLDGREKVLFRAGTPVPITPKIFDLLLILVQNQGHIVEKSTLMNEVWAGSFVEESNLTFSIRQLRKLLGDDAQHPRFIETVPRRGYRFVGRADSSDAEARSFSGRDPSRNGHAQTQASPAFEGRSGLGRFLKPANLLSAGIIAAALLGLAYWWLTERSAANAPNARVERLTSNGASKLAAVSPDAKFVAYIADNDRRQSLRLKNIVAGSDIEILPGVEGQPLGGVTFSPDANYIYYVADGKLFQISVLGGEPRKIVEGVFGSYAANAVTFSPDGKSIAFKRVLTEVNGSSIIIVKTDGTNERVFFSLRRPQFISASPAWAPDGKTIAAGVLTEDGQHKVIVVDAADGSHFFLPSPGWNYIAQLCWAPDGSRLYLAARSRGSVLEQIWKLSYPSGVAERITDDPNVYNGVTLTADGTTLLSVRSKQEAHVWVMPSDGSSQPKQLTRGAEKYDGTNGIDWLPGNRVLYETAPNGRPETWVVGPDGDPKPVSEHGDLWHTSPDGRHFVTQGKTEAGLGLVLVDVETGERRPLTNGTDLWATFSPDGTWIVFTRYADHVGLWKVPVSGGEPIKLTAPAESPVAADVSPDGKLIAFCWWKRGRGYAPSEIAVIPFEGGDVIRSFPVPIQYPHFFGKETIQWTPDGNAINFVAFTDGASNIWRQAIDASAPIRVTNFETGLIFNFAYSPDGTQLALSRGSAARDVVLIRGFADYN